MRRFAAFIFLNIFLLQGITKLLRPDFRFCFLQDAEFTDGEDSVNGDDDINDEISREFPIQEDDGDKYFEPVGGAKKRSSSPRPTSSVLLPPQPIKSAMKKPGQPPRVRKQTSMGKNRL